MATPSIIANQLRQISTRILASKNPDRKLVARDLKRVLASLHTAALTVSPPQSGQHGSVVTVNGVTSSGAQINGARLFVPDEGADGMVWLDPVPASAEPGVGADWDEIVAQL